jgi:hypothetical protein
MVMNAEWPKKYNGIGFGIIGNKIFLPQISGRERVDFEQEGVRGNPKKCFFYFSFGRYENTCFLGCKKMLFGHFIAIFGFFGCTFCDFCLRPTTK